MHDMYPVLNKLKDPKEWVWSLTMAGLVPFFEIPNDHEQLIIISFLSQCYTWSVGRFQKSGHTFHSVYSKPDPDPHHLTVSGWQPQGQHWLIHATICTDDLRVNFWTSVLDYPQLCQLKITMSPFTNPIPYTLPRQTHGQTAMNFSFCCCTTMFHAWSQILVFGSFSDSHHLCMMISAASGSQSGTRFIKKFFHFQKYLRALVSWKLILKHGKDKWLPW